MGARSRNTRSAAGGNDSSGKSRTATSEVRAPRQRQHDFAPSASNGRQGQVSAVEHLEGGWLLVFAGWLVAAAATLGALFFSEVMELPPCVLCWYQRIFMFPLVILLPLGLFPFDRKIVRYALPLAFGGALVALFHALLIAGVVPETIKPCTQGIPCAEAQIEWLGFVTIPLLSLLAFSTIGALLIAARYRISK